MTLFRDRTEAPDEIELAIPSTGPEKRLAVLLVAMLGLWFTGSLHGISSAWVGLAAACLCLLPKFGFVTGEEIGKEVNHRTALYVAGVLGLAALAGQSGLGTIIGNALLKVAPLAQSFATASGLPLLTVLMIQVIGFATPVLPYQASPIVVAMGMAKIPFAAALRLSLALAAITFLILVPLNCGWFAILGWL